MTPGPDAPRELPAEPFAKLREARPQLAYLWLFADVERVTRAHGYALAVHGSATRDLDLIAVPWVKDAKSAPEVAEAVRQACHGDGTHEEFLPVEKEHGRLCWTIIIGGGAFFDFSVMPMTVPLGTDRGTGRDDPGRVGRGGPRGDPVTPGPDAPREVLDRIARIISAWSEDDAPEVFYKGAEEMVREVVSHPAFAPWFLKRLAGQEPTVAETHHGEGKPTGPYKVDWCYSDDPSDRDLHWFVRNGLELIGPFDDHESARTVAACLNASAPWAAAPDAEGGKTDGS